MHSKQSVSIITFAFCFVAVTFAAIAQTTPAKPQTKSGSQANQTVSRTGTCDLAANFPSHGSLRLHIRSGEVHVEGTSDEKITVTCESKQSEDISDVRINFKSNDRNGDLSINGGPHNDFRIMIKIPKRSDLWMRMPAGELHVMGVQGDKDVEVHAGEVTLDIGDPGDYRHVDASVNAGEIDAVAFHVNKGGLFRSFSKSGNGDFRLHAHVGAGQLTLTGQHESVSSM